MQLVWSYSIWLEAVAILPQLLMINKLKDIENITAHYVLFLGMYRIFYIFHWYWRDNIGYWIGMWWFGHLSSLESFSQFSMLISSIISSNRTIMIESCNFLFENDISSYQSIISFPIISCLHFSQTQELRLVCFIIRCSELFLQIIILN